MVNIYPSLVMTKREEFRAFLLACGIPCRVIFNETCGMCKPSLVNIIESGSEVPEGADPESILVSNLDNEDFNSEKMRLYSRILDVLDVKYGINPNFTVTSLYYDTNTDVNFCGISLKLSQSQRMLMKYLALNVNRWCTSHELASFCFVNRVTQHHIAVEMDNIKKRVLEQTGKLIFETKRGAGYKLLTNVRRP